MPTLNSPQAGPRATERRCDGRRHRPSSFPTSFPSPSSLTMSTSTRRHSLAGRYTRTTKESLPARFADGRHTAPSYDHCDSADNFTRLVRELAVVLIIRRRDCARICRSPTPFNCRLRLSPTKGLFRNLCIARGYKIEVSQLQIYSGEMSRDN